MVAPLAGVVVGRKGEAGQRWHESGDDLFVIATDAFDFEIPVEPTPEVLKRLSPGQAVLVIISDVPSSRYAGTVKEIANNQAVIGFTSSVAAVHPGMQARVRLQPE